jgi:hypothetical protein
MRTICAIAFVAVGTTLGMFASPDVLDRPAVAVSRLPDGGTQPQAAVDDAGGVHVIYFRGESAHGDLFYRGSTDGGRTFADPIRVNSTPGAAIATGTVRGGQIAVGRSRRVHVAWNGSQSSAPGRTPMFYARLADGGRAFEPQRNLLPSAVNIDGGGAVAADSNGHVYVVAHANAPGEKDEGKRRVWLVRSLNDGRTFEPEQSMFDEPTGACGCCGLGAFADSAGRLFVLFRSAVDVVHRDMYLLMSRDAGLHTTGKKIDEWNVGMCVMSTQAFAEGASRLYAAWETKGQIYWGAVDSSGAVSQIREAPGDVRTKKHPALAVNARGEVLLAWTEATAWNKGGSAAWQLFDPTGHPSGPSGGGTGVPVWGLVTAFSGRDGSFTIVY